MIDPVIHFKDMDPSPAVEDDVRRRIEALQKRFVGIVAVRVNIEGHTSHHRRGTPYRVVIDVSLPGAALVVGRSPQARAQAENIYVAVRDAFRSAQRELIELRDRMRGDVKLHRDNTEVSAA